MSTVEGTSQLILWIEGDMSFAEIYLKPYYALAAPPRPGVVRFTNTASALEALLGNPQRFDVIVYEPWTPLSSQDSSPALTTVMERMRYAGLQTPVLIFSRQSIADVAWLAFEYVHFESKAGLTPSRFWELVYQLLGLKTA